jgi:hypothetical protein
MGERTGRYEGKRWRGPVIAFDPLSSAGGLPAPTHPMGEGRISNVCRPRHTAFLHQNAPSYFPVLPGGAGARRQDLPPRPPICRYTANGRS